MRRAAARRTEPTAPGWWRTAVFYEIFVRSFADFDGDGVGDLEGIRGRLGYLDLLGVDAIRLTPFYLSPMAADGYDIAGPRAVDPVLGNLDTFGALVAEAHGYGIRVVVDLVPNHTSDKHTWFAAALAARPGSPERDRYHFRDGRGEAGALPPNNWSAVGGGPAWTRAGDGKWFLHLFGPRQPDLNWANPQVPADFERTLRFWLDRGVDGIQIAAASALAKPRDLAPEAQGFGAGFDVEGVHDVHQMIRKVLDEYPHAVLLGDIGGVTDERFARYLRPGELHLAVNPRLASTPFDADALQASIGRALATVAPTGAPPAWALSNHDLPRQASRYGDGLRGLNRARAMALVLLGLPGALSLYNGEELGLPGEDPRVPIPWEGNKPPFGFSTLPGNWPVPAEWATLTVETQLEDESSTLSLYRRALQLRREHPACTGDEVEWYGAPPGCFAYRRRPGGLVCALNTSAAPVPVPRGEVLLSSAPMVAGRLPADAAAWLVVGQRP
ncbi:alpha-amylase family glycosyl hydrolase [Saccharomonospora sp. NPDC046836]|uniref:alpha-amylase family glycosyl hydrolase n=1 Tax=Saccharomonospora sp. NPDC046836 TaxID=3156921 RepID=UPI0033D096E3